MRNEGWVCRWQLVPRCRKMNVGITELVVVCGIVGLLLLFAAMVSGMGLRFLRRENITSQNHDPLEILRIRYARGEITREQYEAMKKDLM